MSQNPGASAPPSAVPASLIPNIPAMAAMPASTTVTPVSRFMMIDSLLFTVER